MGIDIKCSDKIGYQQKLIYYKGKEGKIISGENEILSIWGEFFDELFNNRNMIEQIESLGSDSQENESNEKSHTSSEPNKMNIKEMIKKTRGNKNLGSCI